MTRELAREVVLEALAHVAPEADLGLLPGDELLTEMLEIDSFDFLCFVQALRDACGADLPEDGYLRVATLDGAIEYVASGVS